MEFANIAWMLVVTLMVFLLAPAVALWHSGMARVSSVMQTLLLSLGAMAVSLLVWAAWGWSIAFGGKDLGGIIGDPISGFLFKDVVVWQDGGMFGSVHVEGQLPGTLVFAFQAALSMFAVTLIVGALIERLRYPVWLLFVVLWQTFVYAPITHMVHAGILASKGSISEAISASSVDFAGAATIHLTAAISAIMVALIIGNRHDVDANTLEPANLPLAIGGVMILSFAWLGLNAGSQGSASGSAGYVIMVSALAGSTGLLTYTVLEHILRKETTVFGACSGMIAGLVASSACASSIAPLWSVMLGVFAGAAAYGGSILKQRLNFDDPLNVLSNHGLSALVGLLFAGLFVKDQGLLIGGGWRLLVVQLCLIAVVVIFAGVVSALLGFILEKLLGLRVSSREGVHQES